MRSPWLGHIDYPLPRDVGYIRPATKVKNQYWWAPAVKETVVYIKMSKVGESFAIIYRSSRTLGVGDKLGTAQELKVTVEELLPYEVTVTDITPEDEIPGIIDEKTGREFSRICSSARRTSRAGLGAKLERWPWPRTCSSPSRLPGQRR